MTGAVVDNRVVTATTANFAVHVGTAVSQPITLSTTGDDNYFTRVSVGNAGPDANGISVTGGTNPLFNASTVTDVRTLTVSFLRSARSVAQCTLPTTGEGLPGEAPINVPVNYTAQVFSGKATWNLASGAHGVPTATGRTRKQVVQTRGSGYFGHRRRYGNLRQLHRFLGGNRDP